jgi:hypothetical protein
MASVWQGQRFPFDASYATDEKEGPLSLLCELKTNYTFYPQPRGCKV